MTNDFGFTGNLNCTATLLYNSAAIVDLNMENMFGTPNAQNDPVKCNKAHGLITYADIH